jgi:hypothetical protein
LNYNSTNILAFATLTITDDLVPEVSNVQINGASFQTYPLSSIPLLSLTASVNDSITGNSDLGGANYTIGAQNWSTSQPMSLQNPPTSPTEIFEATLTQPSQSGTFHYYAYGWDVVPNYNTSNSLEFATLVITDDSPPQILNARVNGQPTVTVISGTIVTLNATIDDSTTGNSNVSGANYTIGAQNWPSSVGMNAVVPPFDNPVEDVTQTINTGGWADGFYDIYVYAWDEGPGYNTTSGAFATIVISSDVTPPEVFTVLINGASTQTYPVSSIPPLLLDATIDDSSTGNSDISGANYTVGPQNWTTSQPMSLQNPPTSQTEVFNATLAQPLQPGTYTYYVYGWDDKLNYNTSNVLAFATLIITDAMIPEISNVLINGALAQTYPLSSIPTLNLTATIDDSNRGNSDIGGANYTIGAQNWGTSQPMALQNPPTSPTELFESILTKPSQPGTFAYYVYGWDDVPNYNASNILAFATLTVYDDMPPEISNVLADGATSVEVNAGANVILTASIDDANTGNSNITGANYTIGAQNWATAVNMNATVQPFDNPSEDASLGIDTTGWSPGSYDLYVYARDDALPSPNLNVTSVAYATIVVNAPPALDWTGEANYVSDGLDPETGDTSTVFTFRITYADADNDPPSSGEPKLHVKKGGVEISGSPFATTYLSGSNQTGAIYAHSLTLAEGDDYSYYFSASDDRGNQAVPTSEKLAPDVTRSTGPDTTPPVPPEDVITVTPEETGRLVVSWSANTEGDLAGYQIYRSTTQGSGYELIASLDETLLSYIDKDLDDETTYYYAVTAIDTSGNESPHSAEASGTTSAVPEGQAESGLGWLSWILLILAVTLFIVFLLLWTRKRKEPEEELPAWQSKKILPPPPSTITSIAKDARKKKPTKPCSNCGKELEHEYRLCPYCGAGQDMD